ILSHNSRKVRTRRAESRRAHEIHCLLAVVAPLAKWVGKTWYRTLENMFQIGFALLYLVSLTSCRRGTQKGMVDGVSADFHQTATSQCDDFFLRQCPAAHRLLR